jgi:hypothetical protein
VALFHATPAHRIWTFRAFPTQPAVTPLDVRCSLAVGLARVVAGFPARPFAPTRVHFADPFPHPSNFLPGHLSDSKNQLRHQSPDSPANQRIESREADPGPEASHRTLGQASTGSASDQPSSTRAGENPDSRALLRLSSRSPSGTVKHSKKPMLSWPSPLRGLPARPLGLRPPLPRFPTRLRLPLPKKQARRRIVAPQGLSSRA